MLQTDFIPTVISGGDAFLGIDLHNLLVVPDRNLLCWMNVGILRPREQIMDFGPRVSRHQPVTHTANERVQITESVLPALVNTGV